MKYVRSIAAVVLFFGIILEAAVGVPPEQTPSAAALLKAGLNGVPISRAEVPDLVSAVSSAVKAHPEMAADILAEVFSANRRDMEKIAAQITAVAIRALGPKATPAEIVPLIQVAVLYYPQAVLQIVELAVKVAPDGTGPSIVNAATSAIPGISEELSYEIAQAAYRGKPGIDLAMGNEKGVLEPVGEYLPGLTGVSGIEVPVEEYPRLLATSVPRIEVPVDDVPESQNACTLTLVQ